MQRKGFVIIASLMSLALLQACAAPAIPADTSKSPAPVTSEAQSATTTATVTGTATVAEPAATSADTNIPAPAEGASTVSMLDSNTGYLAYLNLKIDATKEEVEASLGAGKKMETSTFDGAGAEKFEYDKDGQLIWLIFRDGKLISKSTKEITAWSAPITGDQFAQIKNDMTLDEVIALLGPGQLINEDHSYEQSLGEISKTWFWNVKTGYQNITLIFKNDKVSYISDMNMV